MLVGNNILQCWGKGSLGKALMTKLENLSSISRTQIKRRTAQHCDAHWGGRDRKISGFCSRASIAQSDSIRNSSSKISRHTSDTRKNKHTHTNNINILQYSY